MHFASIESHPNCIYTVYIIAKVQLTLTIFQEGTVKRKKRVF